jgi:hypothetical protein
MSKGAFRILLAAYFLFDVVVSLYHSFFGMRVPTSIVHELYMVFGEPVPIPQPLVLTLGVFGVVLFVWAALGLFLFWRGARIVFVLLLVLFAGIAPLKPFYIISGWFEMFMHFDCFFTDSSSALYTSVHLVSTLQPDRVTNRRSQPLAVVMRKSRVER